MRPCSAAWCGCTPPGQKPQSLVCWGSVCERATLVGSSARASSSPARTGACVPQGAQERARVCLCCPSQPVSQVAKHQVGWPSTCLLGSRAVHMLLSHRQWASSALVAVGLACLCWGCAMASLGSSSSSVRFPGVLTNERVSQAQLVIRP